MPIRFVDRRANLGRLNPSLDGVTGLLQGTHVAPPGRLGAMSTQLGGVTPSIIGGFTPGANRTGSIITTLDGASSSISGTFGVPGAPIIADKYFGAGGSNSNNGSQAAPYATLAFALTKINATQSVGMLSNVTETIDWAAISGGGAGSANHKIIRAITPGLVLTGVPGGTNANVNLTFEDIVFNVGTGEGSAQFAQRIVWKRCGFTGGGGLTSGNVAQWEVGSNQAYHGCYWDGTGGRYCAVSFQNTNVVFNECLFRTQPNVWGPPGSNPTGGLTIYSNPSNILAVNCIGIDCENQGNGSEWLGAFNFVSNVGPQTAVRAIQIMALDNVGLIGIQIDGSTNNSVAFTNAVSVRNQHGLILGTHLGSGSVVPINGGEFSNNTQFAVADFGNANSSVNNVNTVGNGLGPFSGISGSGNTTNPLNMAARLGAMKRYGTTYGLLYGETGYDVPTAENLFPFPNQTLIRSKLRAISPRGFCADGFDLTSYMMR
jgi:hypothetical protein